MATISKETPPRQTRAEKDTIKTQIKADRAQALAALLRGLQEVESLEQLSEQKKLLGATNLDRARLQAVQAREHLAQNALRTALDKGAFNSHHIIRETFRLERDRWKIVGTVLERMLPIGHLDPVRLPDQPRQALSDDDLDPIRQMMNLATRPGLGYSDLKRVLSNAPAESTKRRTLPLMPLLRFGVAAQAAEVMFAGEVLDTIASDGSFAADYWEHLETDQKIRQAKATIRKRLVALGIDPNLVIININSPDLYTFDMKVSASAQERALARRVASEALDQVGVVANGYYTLQEFFNQPEDDSSHPLVPNLELIKLYLETRNEELWTLIEAMFAVLEKNARLIDSVYGSFAVLDQVKTGLGKQPIPLHPIHIRENLKRRPLGQWKQIDLPSLPGDRIMPPGLRVLILLITVLHEDTFSQVVANNPSFWGHGSDRSAHSLMRKLDSVSLQLLERCLQTTSTDYYAPDPAKTKAEENDQLEPPPNLLKPASLFPPSIQGFSELLVYLDSARRIAMASGELPTFESGADKNDVVDLGLALLPEYRSQVERIINDALQTAKTEDVLIVPFFLVLIAVSLIEKLTALSHLQLQQTPEYAPLANTIIDYLPDWAKPEEASSDDVKEPNQEKPKPETVTERDLGEFAYDLLDVLLDHLPVTQAAVLFSRVHQAMRTKNKLKVLGHPKFVKLALNISRRLDEHHDPSKPAQPERVGLINDACKTLAAIPAPDLDDTPSSEQWGEFSAYCEWLGDLLAILPDQRYSHAHRLPVGSGNILLPLEKSLPSTQSPETPATATYHLRKANRLSLAAVVQGPDDLVTNDAIVHILRRGGQVWTRSEVAAAILEPFVCTLVTELRTTEKLLANSLASMHGARQKYDSLRAFDHDGDNDVNLGSLLYEAEQARTTADTHSERQALLRGRLEKAISLLNHHLTQNTGLAIKVITFEGTAWMEVGEYENSNVASATFFQAALGNPRTLQEFEKALLLADEKPQETYIKFL